MDPVTALTIGSLLVNLGGNIFSRPKKRNFNANKIFPSIKQGVLESTEAITAPIRQNAGEAATARGLTGGAAAQVVAQAEAPVRAAATQRLSDTWTQLKLQEEQSRYQDSQNQRDWWGQMFGDIASGGAALASGITQRKNDDKLLSILSGDAGGLSGSGGAQKPSGNTLGLFGGKPMLKTKQGVGGLNAMSFMQTPKRRNVRNQFSNPFSFGLGEFNRE
jgi:hypothetical protein